MTDSKKPAEPRTIANESGYLLQMALKDRIESLDPQRWRIETIEHGWVNPVDGARGWADLVLSRGTPGYGEIVMVVECKRFDGDWVFQEPQLDAVPTKRARALWARRTVTGSCEGSWLDVTADPESPESQFCSTRRNRRSHDPIEPIARELLASMDGIADEFLELFQPRTGFPGTVVFVPVIVTTARLTVLRFNPAEVSLENGRLKPRTGEAEPASLVRFRKALSVELSPGAKPVLLDEANADRTRTIWIASAEAFPNILQQFEIRFSIPYRTFPWEFRRRRG